MTAHLDLSWNEARIFWQGNSVRFTPFFGASPSTFTRKINLKALLSAGSFFEIPAFNVKDGKLVKLDHPSPRVFGCLELADATNQGIPEKPNNQNLLLGARCVLDQMNKGHPSISRLFWQNRFMICSYPIERGSIKTSHVNFRHDNFASLLRSLAPFFSCRHPNWNPRWGGRPMLGRWRLLNIQVMS